MTSSQAKQIAEQYLSWLVGRPAPHQLKKLVQMLTKTNPTKEN